MEGMTLEAWVAVLAVVCVALVVSLVASVSTARSLTDALRSEQVARVAERTMLEREREVLRQAVEQQHGKSPVRSVAIITSGVAQTPEQIARAIGHSLLDGMEP